MPAIRDGGTIRCCRICDIFIAFFVIALSLPVMVAVAVVLKTDRSGPVLRRRVRVCRNGRWIQMLEFHTAANHGREVTRVHRLVRRTRIDMLPQTINVLRGDLTFLGNDRPGFLT